MFQNETTRRSVIAAVLMLLLLGSVSLAYLTTIARRVEFDGLALSLQRHWKQVSQPDATDDHLGTVAVFYSDAIDSPKLIVASLKTEGLRSSDDVLALSMKAMRIVPEPHSKLSKLQLKNISGHLYTSWQHFIRRGRRLTRAQMLAVVTGDERRHWMIYMSTIGGNAHNLTPPRPNLQFAEILNSIEIRD